MITIPDATREYAEAWTAGLTKEEIIERAVVAERDAENGNAVSWNRQLALEYRAIAAKR